MSAKSQVQNLQPSLPTRLREIKIEFSHAYSDRYSLMDRKQYFSYLRLATVASLTLGLAPFFPQPHIIGKLRWLWGGAVGMQAVDWFDLALHGTPWLLLIVLLVYGMVAGKFFPKKR